MAVRAAALLRLRLASLGAALLSTLALASRVGYRYGGLGGLHAAALLLDRKADVDTVAVISTRAWSAQCTATWSAVHCAAHRGDAEMLGLLIERSADISARATRGTTALHLAVYKARLGAAQLLVASSLCCQQVAAQ